MHACLVADELGIKRVFVPKAPGAMSAEGLLLSDVRVDRAITMVRRGGMIDATEVSETLASLKNDAVADLQEQGFGADTSRAEGSAELRYAGQAYEIRVPIDLNVSADKKVREAIAAFHEAHRDRYGFSYEGEHEVELVNLSVAAFGALSGGVVSEDQATDNNSTWADSELYTRKMYDRTSGEYLECKVYGRPFKHVADRAIGPCVIEQYDTTIVVDSGWHARSMADGNIVLERA